MTEPDTIEETTDEPIVEEPAEDEGAAELGDAGKQALDRMKAARNAERDRRRALEQELADLRSTPAGDEPDTAAIQSAADAAAQAKANARIIRSEVKAAAAGKLADPADAYRFLDLSAFEVDENGDVDETEIAEAIADLVSKKPYLGVVSQRDDARFKGTADGGTRKETRPSQLTDADLARMSPQAIEAARVAGRLDDLLSGKSS